MIRFENLFATKGSTLFSKLTTNQFLYRGAVKKSPLNKRPVGGGKENAVPQKKRRTLFNKKNSSLMSLNFSVMKVQ